MTEKRDKTAGPPPANEGSPEGPPAHRERDPNPNERSFSMLLSERPSPTSSASLLSLANAYAAASGAPDAAAATSIPAPVPPPPSSSPVVEPIQEMRERFSLGDYTGALAIAESLLEGEHATEAQRCSDTCKGVLEKMYAARIGPLDRVPYVLVPREQLRWLSIDHRAGFILSHVDGVSTFEMIIDVSGMPTLDVLRIVQGLLQDRVIGIRR